MTSTPCPVHPFGCEYAVNLYSETDGVRSEIFNTKDEARERAEEWVRLLGLGSASYRHHADDAPWTTVR